MIFGKKNNTEDLDNFRENTKDMFEEYERSKRKIQDFRVKIAPIVHKIHRKYHPDAHTYEMSSFEYDNHSDVIRTFGEFMWEGPSNESVRECYEFPLYMVMLPNELLEQETDKLVEKMKETDKKNWERHWEQLKSQEQAIKEAKKELMQQRNHIFSDVETGA